MKYVLSLIAALALLPASALAAETCTTQSQMKPAERDGLAAAASTLAARIQADDAAGVRGLTIAEFRSDFAPMSEAIAATAPRLAGAQPEVEQLYLLDASTLARTPAGANPDAQFFCTLNGTANEAGFSIPQLPPGRYAFAMVRMESASPWRISMLLRQEAAGSGTTPAGARWLLAGLYPKRLTAGGHDGLWYWKQARALDSGTGAAKEPWNAWLFFQEAQSLLQPASFVSSSHLDKLANETGSALPPALSGGLGAETPLVVRAADGAEFRFTSLSVDDSLGNDKVDVAAHLKVDSLTDAAAARKRNVDAISALVAAHPELRKAFHGVWIFADAPNQSPYATELSMAEIR